MSQMQGILQRYSICNLHSMFARREADCCTRINLVWKRMASNAWKIWNRLNGVKIWECCIKTCC